MSAQERDDPRPSAQHSCKIETHKKERKRHRNCSWVKSIRKIRWKVKANNRPNERKRDLVEENVWDARIHREIARDERESKGKSCPAQGNISKFEI